MVETLAKEEDSIRREAEKALEDKRQAVQAEYAARLAALVSSCRTLSNPGITLDFAGAYEWFALGQLAS
jgi:hypothetical protein